MGDEGRRQALSLPRVTATPPQGRHCKALQGLPLQPQNRAKHAAIWPSFAPLPLPVLTLTPSSQIAVSWGRLVTTHWDPYLSIHLTAGAGRAKGRLHFSPHHNCLFFWRAEMVLNHSKLWRSWTALSHSLGKHLITRLYFLQIDVYSILNTEHTNPTSSHGEKGSVRNLV